jgi:hypothetical protein
LRNARIGITESSAFLVWHARCSVSVRMSPRSRFSFAALAILGALSVPVACSSSSTGDSKSGAPADFCSVANDALTRCGTSTCSSFAADCSKLSALLNPTLLDAAASCIKASDCSGGGPLSCLGSTLGDVKPSAAQEKLGQDYCASCSVVGGDTCTSAFANTLGKIALPFGDAPVSAVDDSCTKNALGKTACQAAFSTCVQTELTKSLATSISADTASCLLDAIKAGLSSSSGDGGGGEGGAPPEGGSDGAVSCTDLANSASFVVLERVSGAPPAALGGAIVDGTYTLLSLRAYDGAPAGTITIKRTIRIAGSKLESISELTDPPEIDSTSGAFVATGATFSRSLTCPPPTYSDSAGYTTDGNALTLIFSDHTVYTYGRQ